MEINNSHAEEDEEIIIKCGLDEIIKQFFKEYVVAWHDPDVNSPENLKYIHQIEKFCEVKTFTDWKKASTYIREAKAICHVITSGTNGESLIKEIHLSQQVSQIHILCQNKDCHSSLFTNYEKVSSVETDLKTIVNQIEQSLLNWYKQASSLKTTLPAFAPVFDESDKSTMNNLHRYLKVIPRFKSYSQAKNDFVNLSKAVYSDHQNVKSIQEFEQNYHQLKKSDILKWYTKDSFLYKVTNNCLRIATSDSIQYCRLILSDIERAIKECYQEKSKHFNGLLYRGAYLSEQEWMNLKANINREIEMHGFLSASKKKNVALNFLKADPTNKVIITILIPKGPNDQEQGFAEISEFSEYASEQEVLFNVRSRFTVLETQDKYSQSLPYRHLVLLYGAQSFRKYLAEQNPVQEISIQNLNKISCKLCQVKVHEMPAEKMFFVSFVDLKNQNYICKGCLHDIRKTDNAPLLCVQTISDQYTTNIQGLILRYPTDLSIPFYGYECHHCQGKNPQQYFKCTECNEGKENTCCENCVEHLSDCITAEHAVVLESNPFSLWCEKMTPAELIHVKFQNELITKNDHLFRQAAMYYESQEYQKAFEYYSIYIQKNQNKCNDVNLASAYNRLGLVCNTRGEYKNALEYSFKALEIFIAIFGESHPSVAASYNNLASIFDSQGEYKKAIEYYDKSHEIYISIHGDNHPETATSYNNIGLVFNTHGEYEKALEYLYKSLEINEAIYQNNHPELASSYQNIASVHQIQGEYNKALEYGFKCLDIRKSVHGENHPDTASSYHNIASIYDKQAEYKKALEFYSKSLEIRKSFYQQNHPDLANSYHQIGVVYNNQGQYAKAFEYYSECLRILKSIHGDTHPHIATSYDSLGLICRSQQEYTKAFEYYHKSLEIRQSFYQANHPSIADSYHSIGSVYNDQKEYEKALEYYLKSFQIRELVYGNHHHEIANSYFAIGSVYESQGEYDKALEYQSKSLEIRESVYGKNHPKMALSYMNIGLAYNQQKEYHKAFEYYSKCVEIYKVIYGENHLATLTMNLCKQKMLHRSQKQKDLEQIVLD